MKESIVFLLRVQCRRKESSRSLSHLLMSFLFTIGKRIWGGDRSMIAGLYLDCIGRGVTGKQGVWGRKSPSGVQGQSPGGGMWAKPHKLLVQCNIVPIKVVSVHHLFVFHC